MERYTGDGIRLSATIATELFVSDTVSRDNGWQRSPCQRRQRAVTVENSRFENNGDTGLVLSVAKTNVIRSVASGNLDGVYVSVGEITLTETTAADNSNLASMWIAAPQRPSPPRWRAATALGA